MKGISVSCLAFSYNGQIVIRQVAVPGQRTVCGSKTFHRGTAGITEGGPEAVFEGATE